MEPTEADIIVVRFIHRQSLMLSSRLQPCSYKHSYIRKQRRSSWSVPALHESIFSRQDFSRKGAKALPRSKGFFAPFRERSFSVKRTMNGVFLKLLRPG
jgi:hypothetical protein